MLDEKATLGEKLSLNKDDVPSNRTRREFLELSLAAGGIGLLGGATGAAAQSSECPFPDPGTPVPFQPTYGPTLPRVSAFETQGGREAPQLTKLRQAYAAMRELGRRDPSDPRGYMQQANVHCYYCSGGIHEIHGSWSFLAWHRCYLFMHERILARLVDDATLRLVYWDWDTPTRNFIPDPFKTGSLSDPLRRSGLDDPIPASLVGPAAMRAAMRPLTFTGFGGSPTSSGSLENNPHGPVHCWTSCDQPGCCQPDMGVLATAGRDPIFFAHHANIDRLWAVWLKQPGRKNPTDSRWLDMRWGFFNENKVWTSISVRDVLDYESNLHYSYDCLKYSSPECKDPGAPVLSVATEAQPVRLTAEPRTSSVSVPSHVKLASAAAAATPLAASGRVHYLHIDGIDVPSDQAALLRVFVNTPDATADTDIDTPNFLGYVSAVAKVQSADAHHDHGTFNVTLDITHQAAALLAADDFEVTLVPVSLNGDDQAEEHDVSYQSIYVTSE